MAWGWRDGTIGIREHGRMGIQVQIHGRTGTATAWQKDPIPAKLCTAPWAMTATADNVYCTGTGTYIKYTETFTSKQPHLSSRGRESSAYCLFGVNKYFFQIFIFYAWFGMLLKGMGESLILSKDEPLTPNIDGVMVLWIFRRRAQTAYVCMYVKSAKLGPLNLSFYFFRPRPLEEIRSNLLILEPLKRPR